MTMRFKIGKLALVAWGIVCLAGAGAPQAQAQAGRAADRAAKEAVRRSKPKTPLAAQRIQPDRKRPAAKRRGAGVSPDLIERLMRMPSAERRRFLRENPRFQQLPPGQRQRIQQRLERLSRMPPRQRELALERYQLFQRLPRHKRQQARAIYQRWRRISPVDRKQMIQEFRELRRMRPDARQERFSEEDFRDKFSKSQRQILKDLTELLPKEPVD